jgi:murein L,D-transpeptidase YcbB/YkuD
LNVSPRLIANLILIAWTAAAGAQVTPNEALRERIDLIRYVPGTQLDAERIFSTHVLPELYERRGFDLLWRNPGAAESLLATLRHAADDGLNPDDYHLAALARANDGAPGAVATRDILLTDALLAFLYHLRVGKVDPVSLDPQWNYGGELKIDDAILVQLESAIETGNIDAAMAEARPKAAIYDQLRSALAAYRDLERAGGWPAVTAGATLKAAMSDPRVVELRRRLAVTDAATLDVAAPATYDDELVEAVRRFQRRHRMTADGAVGPATLRELNVPVAKRVDQLRVNLERVRWVPQIAEPRFVLVDVAGFHVSLIENGRIAWRARAMVGRPYRRTPIFGSRITYVVVNPTWTIPPGILGKDTLPAIRRDSAYLAQHDMEVVDRNGRLIDASSVDFARYTGNNFPYMIRQRPGPENALGVVKIMFPNDHFVYLHDTPSRALFDRDERAFSSGCIRVERPLDLVERLLGDPARWSRAQLEGVVASGKTRTINLTASVPVAILYWTAEVDEAGWTVFKSDIYQRDPAVLAGLDAEFSWGRRTIERASSVPAAGG